MTYSIIKHTEITDNMDTRDIQILYSASLGGNMFTRDSRKFRNILKELTIGNSAKIWIKGLNCDRKTMQYLQDHYDGIL